MAYSLFASKEHLNIASENKVEENWKPDTMAFWTELVEKLINVTPGTPSAWSIEFQPCDGF